MNKLNARIEQLETLHRIQRSNAEHYFWNENNDVLGHHWQDISKETKKEIDQLHKERAIVEKWQKAEAEG